MKIVSKKPKLSLILMGLTVLGLTGFMVWRSVSCPGCFASEPKQIGVLENLPETNESSLENQVTERKPILPWLELGNQTKTQEPEAKPQIGSLAPNFTLKDSEGREVSLTDYAGRNVLLVFWATFCGWCEKERPDLIRFTREKKNQIEVLVIVWEPKKTVKKYISKKQINFPILLDSNGEVQVKYLAFGTPNHFWIDKERRLVVTRPGYANYDDLIRLSVVLEAND